MHRGFEECYADGRDRGVATMQVDVGHITLEPAKLSRKFLEDVTTMPPELRQEVFHAMTPAQKINFADTSDEHRALILSTATLLNCAVISVRRDAVYLLSAVPVWHAPAVHCRRSKVLCRVGGRVEDARPLLVGATLRNIELDVSECKMEELVAYADRLATLMAGSDKLFQHVTIRDRNDGSGRTCMRTCIREAEMAHWGTVIGSISQAMPTRILRMALSCAVDCCHLGDLIYEHWSKSDDLTGLIGHLCSSFNLWDRHFPSLCSVVDLSNYEDADHHHSLSLIAPVLPLIKAWFAGGAAEAFYRVRVAVEWDELSEDARFRRLKNYLVNHPKSTDVEESGYDMYPTAVNECYELTRGDGEVLEVKLRWLMPADLEVSVDGSSIVHLSEFSQ